jgi:hypothetical protein
VIAAAERASCDRTHGIHEHLRRCGLLHADISMGSSGRGKGPGLRFPSGQERTGFTPVSIELRAPRLDPTRNFPDRELVSRLHRPIIMSNAAFS